MQSETFAHYLSSWNTAWHSCHKIKQGKCTLFSVMPSFMPRLYRSSSMPLKATYDPGSASALNSTVSRLKSLPRLMPSLTCQQDGNSLNVPKKYSNFPNNHWKARSCSHAHETSWQPTLTPTHENKHSTKKNHTCPICFSRCVCVFVCVCVCVCMHWFFAL